MQPYKEEVSFQKRQTEAARIQCKFPDRVPVVAEPIEDASRTPLMIVQSRNRRKYLVPADMTVGQFVYILRTQFKLPATQAMFIFINSIMPPTSALIASMYQQHADEDGFLYVTYAGENVFG